MDRRNFILTGLMALCVILAAGSAVAFFIKINGMKRDNIILAKQVKALRADRDASEELVRELKEEKVRIEKELKKLEATMRALSQQVEDEKEKFSKSSTAAKNKEVEIKKLKANIAKLEKEKKNLLKRVNLMNQAFEDTKTKFDELLNLAEKESEKRVMELEERIRRISDRTEEPTSLGTVVVR